MGCVGLVCVCCVWLGSRDVPLLSSFSFPPFRPLTNHPSSLLLPSQYHQTAAMAVPESILKKRRTQEALLAKKVAATAAAKKASGREMRRGEEGWVRFRVGGEERIVQSSLRERAEWRAACGVERVGGVDGEWEDAELLLLLLLLGTDDDGGSRVRAAAVSPNHGDCFEACRRSERGVGEAHVARLYI